MELIIEDWPTDYVKLCWQLVADGRERQPRGRPTWEFPNATLVFPKEHDSNRLLPVGCGRNLNLAIAAVEALQLCAGLALPDLTVAVSENFEPYREDDGRFWGAYGDRITVDYGNQITHQAELARRKLEDDVDTRQAVITLWNPDLDNDPGKRDYPCTISLVFAGTAAGLELTTFMRSNDAWLGLPYDVFQFTQLQQTMANLLGVERSTYTHHAVSLHLYQSDINNVRKLRAAEEPLGLELPTGFGTAGQSFDSVTQFAKTLIERSPTDLSDYSKAWYEQQLRPHINSMLTDEDDE